MKWNWSALSIVACMVGAVLAGCAPADRGLTGAAAARTVKGDNEHCDWEFDTGLQGKLDESTFKAKPKPGKDCKAIRWGEDTSKKMYIGDGSTQWEVRDLPFVQFFLKGSCRRCWPNTAGGMTCVEYPGSC